MAEFKQKLKNLLDTKVSTYLIKNVKNVLLIKYVFGNNPKYILYKFEYKSYFIYFIT